MSRAPKEAAREDAHYARKARKARTPLERTAVEFDKWRRVVSRLPADFADRLAGEMTATLTVEITKLKPRGGGDGS